MVIKALRFLSGYVEFSVKGDYPERFLNQLAAYRIPFWNIGRSADGLTLSVLLKDYKKLHKVKGKNRIVTRVSKRHGMPFCLKRHRLRTGLIVGAVLYLAVLFYMSGFVWNIKVEGIENLGEKQVLSVCRELGLYEGAKIKSIDAESFRVKLALKLPNIAWASVNIEGSTATVNISESIDTVKTDQTPCNLVAKRDGVIEAIEVNQGTTKVKLGQTVKSGDLLVSGVTEYKDGSFSFGRSSGKIMARTTRTLSYLATFKQTEEIYVEEPKVRSVLSIFGLEIPLYFGSLKGNYERETKEHKITYNGAYLPVKITTATFRQVDIRAYLIDEETARQIAVTKLEELERQELKNAEILSKNVEFFVSERGVEVVAQYSCRENIAECDFLLIYE